MGCQAEHPRMLMDRTIYDNAVRAKERELVLELEATARLRRHSTELQRSIETLVEARTRAAEEAIASRHAEPELLQASRDAQGRSGPTVIKLRKQLIDVEQEAHEETLQQAEELRTARLLMQDLTRQEASVCLDLRRANSRLTEAQKVIDSTDEQIHRWNKRCLSAVRLLQNTPAASRYMGGVDPAVGYGRGAYGPAAMEGS